MHSVPVLLFVVAGGVLASAQDFAACHRWDELGRIAPSDKVIVLDLASGGGPDYKRRFRAHDRVRVLVMNMNPFVSKYRITVTATPVQETGLSGFLSLLGAPVSDVLAAATPAEVTDASAAAAAVVTPQALGGCTTSDLAARAGVLYKELTELQRQSEALQKKVKGVAGRLDFSKLTASGLRGNEICKIAGDLVKAATEAGAIDVDKFERQIEVVREKAIVLSALAKERQQESACANSAPVKIYLGAAESVLEVKLPTATKQSETTRKWQEAAETNAKKIQDALSDGDALATSRFVGDYDDPTNVELKVEARATNATTGDFSTLADLKLNFGGGPRFTLAGGLTIANLTRQEFVRVQGYARGPGGDFLRPIQAGGDRALENVVGLNDRGDWRVGPIVMLHSRLFQKADYGVYLSAGVTAKASDASTKIEYLFGPSLAFLNNRVFLTFGAYGGNSKVLEGGLYLQAPVPDKLTELPVRTNFKWRPGVAITWAFR